MDHGNDRKILFASSFSCLIIFWVLITCTAVAVSETASYKLQEADNESIIALIFIVVNVGGSFIVLLSVTLPAACIHKNGNNCCTPTYYNISVVVAGLISVIGTSVTGILLIFAAYYYKKNNPTHLTVNYHLMVMLQHH